MNVGCLAKRTAGVGWTEEPELVEIAALILDHGTFPREIVDQETVGMYAEQMQEEGVHFPPIRVIKLQAGQMILVDGWHRVAAAKSFNCTKLYARVRPGSRSDAIEAAAAQNTRHGRPRTNADKRKAVEMLFVMPKWRDASNREIARHCGVSHPFVATVRSGTWPPSQVNASPSGNVSTPALLEPPRSQPLSVSDDTESVSDDTAVVSPERMPEPAVATRPSISAVMGGAPRSHGPWPGTPVAKTISYVDILAWLMNATDPQRRKLADDAFGSIESPDERLRHDAKVQEWLDEHEKEMRA